MDRRRAARRAPIATEPLSRVRLRGGRELAVIDVSDAGVLVEGGRLLPGTHVDAHVITGGGRALTRSRVVRCHVCALEPTSTRYRGALAFEQSIDTSPAGYEVPIGTSAVGPGWVAPTRLPPASLSTRGDKT